MFISNIRGINIPESERVWVTLPRLPGAEPGGGGTAPPKIEKNMNFWRKIVIFHTKYPKYFRFWRKIVIFHTKYPNNFPLGAIFLSAPPLTWNPGSAPGYYYWCTMIAFNISRFSIFEEFVLIIRCSTVNTPYPIKSKDIVYYKHA